MITSAKQIAGCRWSLPCIRDVMKTYKAMALQAKKDKEGAWICQKSARELAKEVGIGPRTICHHIAELEAENIIKIEVMEIRNTRKPVEVYVFNMERINELFEEKKAIQLMAACCTH